MGVKTDPLHIEGQRLPASGFRLSPAQHHVGVAHLAGVDVGGRERSFDLTCRAKERRRRRSGMKTKEKKEKRSVRIKQKVLFLVYFFETVPVVSA